MEITLGVPVGVSRGVIYGVRENLCAVFLETVDQTISISKPFFLFLLNKLQMLNK